MLIAVSIIAYLFIGILVFVFGHVLFGEIIDFDDDDDRGFLLCNLFFWPLILFASGLYGIYWSIIKFSKFLYGWALDRKDSIRRKKWKDDQEWVTKLLHETCRKVMKSA